MKLYKTKIYRFLPLVILGLMAIHLSSCSDFLEEEPLSDVSDETYWNDQDDANSGIAGCYAQLRKALNNGLSYYAHGDLATDFFSTDRGLNHTNYDYAQKVQWGVSVASTSTSNEMYILRDFEKFYSTIRQANLCIDKIPTISEDDFDDYETAYNQFMGEAYFIRAYSYFYMAHVWGAVPIINDNMVDEVDLTDYARSDEEEVLAKAIEDCETAISYLSWDYLDDEDKAVRANKGTAWALLAHIYAWQGNYEACEAAAKKVTESGYYSYVDRDDYLDIYDGQSDEGIFEIAQDLNTEAQYATVSIGGMLLRDDYLTYQEETTIWPFDTLALRNRFFTDESDLRVQNAFWEFSSKYPVLLKYSNITYSSSTYAVSQNNIIIFRLSGIALLEAEAEAAQGEYSSARAILNEIRGLAGLEESTATNEDLFEEIIDERGRELFMEGHRFYDLVRLAKEKGIYKFGYSESDKITESEFAEGKYHWPIQPSLLETNPLLTQTSYWASEME